MSRSTLHLAQPWAGWPFPSTAVFPDATTAPTPQPTPAPKAEPQHQHDCTHCVFLGRWGKYDLYHHAGYFGGADETLIARFGTDGDYHSGLHFAQPYTDITGQPQPGIPSLVEARRRAVERGLIV